jgi:hypothetical protein
MKMCEGLYCIKLKIKGLLKTLAPFVIVGDT